MKTLLTLRYTYLLPYFAPFLSRTPFLHFGPVLRTFLYYLIAFCSRLEGTGDAISGRFVGPVVVDKHVKLHDHTLNRSRAILPEAVGGGIFDCFSL